MSGETLSTNMNLPVPGVGVTAGPQWATDIVSSLNIIDAHDHSSGSGVKITPDGLNINSDLSFQNTSSATNVFKTAFTSQSSALTGTNFLSFIGGNLYVNDGSGNQIPITSAGGVAGSPGSIGSLTSPAAATYSAGSKLFTWTADSSKAAAMDNGAVTIRETNVASAKGITLASPSSLAADYQLTLPAALPGSTQALNVTSGGVVASISYDGIGQAMTSTGANAIAATMTSTGANAVAATRTRTTGTSVGAGGVAIGATVSGYTNATTTYSNVTNTITITTSGRPVFVGVRGAEGASSEISVTTSITGASPDAIFKFIRGASDLGIYEFLSNGATGVNGSLSVPPSSLWYVDAVAAGTYTYRLLAKAGAANCTVFADQIELVVYEL